MADEYKSIYSGQEVDNAVATAQKALTTDNLVQTTGPSPNNVMSQAATTAAIQNIKAGTTVTVNNVAQTTWNADTKVDVFQGIDNTGKVMVVNSSGNLQAETIQSGGTTVTVNGQAQATWNADTKINIFQGTENAGKTFMVGQDGDAVLITVPTMTTETQTIESTSWSELSDSSPYTYSATVTATTTIGTDSIVELINNQAVLFATYGFAIGSISGQNITIYSIGQPSTSVTLTVGVTG